MGLLTKFLKVNGTVAIGGATYTAYIYPELRREPGQLLHAMVRGVRCGTTGALMASDYIMAMRSSDGITEETHRTASLRMYECFCKNGGPYIKLG